MPSEQIFETGSLNVNVREFESGDEDLWDAFVDQHKQSTFFHKVGWRAVIQRSFGHACPYLIAEESGEITGVLPLVDIKSFLFGHGMISNGYCVSGGPLTSNEKSLTALTNEAMAITRKRKADYLEFRCPSALNDQWKTRDNLYAGFSRVMEREEDKCLNQIPRKQRAVVRKAIAGPLSVRFEDTIDNLYDLYALSVRNLGTPVFAKKYFQNLFDVFGEDCKILTVFSESEKPLSSVMNFYFKDHVLPFYTGANPEARRVGASDLQYWHTMRDAVERGYSVFDFGRSKVDTGPYKFKKNWGFEPVPLVHQFYLPRGNELPNVNPTNPKYQLFISVWKKLPLPVANFIGPYVVKGIG